MRPTVDRIKFLCRQFLLCGQWLLVLAVLAGCSSSIAGWQVRTNSTEMPPSFYPRQFEQHPVALLGAITRPALRGNEIGLSFYLEGILEKVAPTWKVLSPQETATRINAQGLTEEYIRMRLGFEDSRILDRNILKKIGEAIGVRYMFLPSLADFSQRMTERWTFPLVDVRIAETRSSHMRMSLYLWNVETGELLWECMAEAAMEREGISQDPIYMEDIARATLGSMVSDFLNRKRASKYTPLTKFLDNLIKEAVPEEKPKEDERGGAPAK